MNIISHIADDWKLLIGTVQRRNCLLLFSQQSSHGIFLAISWRRNISIKHTIKQIFIDALKCLKQGPKSVWDYCTDEVNNLVVKLKTAAMVIIMYARKRALRWNVKPAEPTYWVVILVRKLVRIWGSILGRWCDDLWHCGANIGAVEEEVLQRSWEKR